MSNVNEAVVEEYEYGSKAMIAKRKQREHTAQELTCLKGTEQWILLHKRREQKSDGMDESEEWGKLR